MCNPDKCDKDMTVVLVISNLAERKEKVWYNKLVSILEGTVNKKAIASAIRKGIEWGMIRGEFGETDNHRPGKLLYPTGESKALLKKLYKDNKKYIDSILDY